MKVVQSTHKEQTRQRSFSCDAIGFKESDSALQRDDAVEGLVEGVHSCAQQANRSEQEVLHIQQ